MNIYRRYKTRKSIKIEFGELGGGKNCDTKGTVQMMNCYWETHDGMATH